MFENLKNFDAAASRLTFGLEGLKAVFEDADKRVKRAYEKLRAYKVQQAGLVKNQRILKLEYKELKSKYDAALREIVFLSEKEADLTERNMELAGKVQRLQDQFSRDVG